MTNTIYITRELVGQLEGGAIFCVGFCVTTFKKEIFLTSHYIMCFLKPANTLSGFFLVAVFGVFCLTV